MIRTKLRTVVDDLAKDFKQVFDDKQLQRTQIAHWVIMIGNRLLSQHIGKRDSGAFLNVFTEVPVEISEKGLSKNLISGRKHIELPANIFDYTRDGGIEYIAYFIDKELPGCPPAFTNQIFTRTTPSDAQRLFYNKYEEPSAKNPYFYRVGDYIYFLGIDNVPVESVEIGIYSTLKPVTDINLDDDFDFPEELLIQLKRQVLDLGRFVMMIPEDRVNDASNIKESGLPTNKIVSVNEMNEDVPTNE
jgi:hypothetical protein